MSFIYYSVFIVFIVQSSGLAPTSTVDDDPFKSPSNFSFFDAFNSFPNVYIKSQPALRTSGTLAKSTSDILQGTGIAPSTKTQQPSTFPSYLETFISVFINSVHTSPILSNLFDISSTSLQSLENYVYQAVYSILEEVRVSHLHEIATYTSTPLTENFEVLTYPTLIRIDANAIGKQLLAEGILNDTNPARLALSFANIMESSAKQTVKNNYPESKFQALMEGYVGFLKSQGLYTPEKLLDAGRYYGDEVKLAGKRFGLNTNSYALINV